MNTLTSNPVSSLLERLYKQSDASAPALDAFFNPLSQDEQRRLMGSKTDYLDLFTRLKDIPLPVSRETGRLLYMLARSCGARNVVEFGTSFGVSTLHLAAALRDNGGGRLITTEFEASKMARAKQNLEAAGLADLVDFREGDALQTLQGDLPDTIELLLLDGAKSLYSDILKLVEGRLRVGAVIVADNANFCPEYLTTVRSASAGYLSVPMGDNVELSVRLEPT